MSRVQMGVLVASIFFGCSALGGLLWSLLVLLSIHLGQKELRKLLEASGSNPSQTIIYVAAGLMVIAATISHTPQLLSSVLTLTLIASFFRLLFRHPRASIGDIGSTLLAVFYMVYLPAHFIMLRSLNMQSGALPAPWQFSDLLPNFSAWHQPGLHYLVMVLAVISASDIAAYYVGKKFGHNLLYPAISPKKTREGALGGLLGGIALGVACALMWHFPIGHAVILSILLVVVGQLGDLTESMMKRSVGLKDSGALLASHGGFLDRADSYIFSGAVCYYYVYWIVLRQGIAPEVFQWFQHLRFGA